MPSIFSTATNTIAHYDLKTAQPESLKNLHQAYRSIFKCEFCEKLMITKAGWETHLKRHTGDLLPCTVCDFKTAYAGVLKKHILIHELGNKGIDWPKRPNTHKCQLCDYLAPSEGRVLMHARIHFDELPYECSILGCGHRTKWKGNLKQHEQRHDPIKSTRFKCAMCPKGFCTDYQLIRHLRTHTQERPRECPDCDYKAATLVQVKRHQRKHHVLPSFFENSVKGNDIGGQMYSSVALNSFRLIALENGRKVKRQPKAANKQRRIYIYPKTNICSVCGYASSRSLKDHMGVHLDDKPFHCQAPDCNFKSKWATSLEEHTKRLHTPNKYICPLVGCDFQSQDSVLSRKHRRFHKLPLKKNLQCPLCPKKYASKVGLDAHVVSHTGEKAFKCELCDYTGKTLRSIRMHFGRTHSRSVHQSS